MATALSPEANDSFLLHHVKPLAFVDPRTELQRCFITEQRRAIFICVALFCCQAVRCGAGGTGAVMGVGEAEVLPVDHFLKCEVLSGPARRGGAGQIWGSHTH